VRLARHPGHRQPVQVAEARRAPGLPLGMNVCPALITVLAHSVAGPVRFLLEPGRLYLFDAMTQQALGMV
jgi:hypothetical protein